jgi:hypothetical protein
VQRDGQEREDLAGEIDNSGDGLGDYGRKGGGLRARGRGEDKGQAQGKKGADAAGASKGGRRINNPPQIANLPHRV